MKAYYDRDGITIYHADCREVLPTLAAGSVDLVLTDPPYLTNDERVPIMGNGGVAPITVASHSIGVPWGYSLDWVEIAARLAPKHWAVFCNYRMLGGLCTEVERYADVSTVFVWRKANAPNMTRPVPRLDCEFIVWARTPHVSTRRMGEFRSMVLDVPMPQAGCFATERITVRGSGQAAHPTQKPLAVVLPFADRLMQDVLPLEMPA